LMSRGEGTQKKGRRLVTEGERGKETDRRREKRDLNPAPPRRGEGELPARIPSPEGEGALKGEVPDPCGFMKKKGGGGGPATAVRLKKQWKGTRIRPKENRSVGFSCHGKKTGRPTPKFRPIPREVEDRPTGSGGKKQWGKKKGGRPCWSLSRSREDNGDGHDPLARGKKSLQETA